MSRSTGSSTVWPDQPLVEHHAEARERLEGKHLVILICCLDDPRRNHLLTVGHRGEVKGVSVHA